MIYWKEVDMLVYTRRQKEASNILHIVKVSQFKEAKNKRSQEGKEMCVSWFQWDRRRQLQLTFSFRYNEIITKPNPS